MKVKSLSWGGTRTERFDETIRFMQSVMGMELVAQQRDFASFKAGQDKFEVFGPDESDHDFFTTGPVIGFGVDDVDSARAEMEQAGVEFIGVTHNEGAYKWAHFRAPDGNVYEISSD